MLLIYEDHIENNKNNKNENKNEKAIEIIIQCLEKFKIEKSSFIEEYSIEGILSTFAGCDIENKKYDRLKIGTAIFENSKISFEKTNDIYSQTTDVVRKILEEN